MDMKNVSEDEAWGGFRATRLRARSTSCSLDESVRVQVSFSKTQEHFTQVCRTSQTTRERIQDGVMTQTVLEASYPPSTRPFSDLESIMILDLERGSHHRGKSLLLRIAEVSWGFHTIDAIVEDERGARIVLQFLHCPNRHQGLAGDPIKKGQALILKEPFLHTSIASVSTRKPCLRVDHITDVVWLDSSNPKRPTKWEHVAIKSRDTIEAPGFHAMYLANKMSDWEGFVGHASEMISSAKDDNDRWKGYLHRSAGNLNLGRASIAFEDASKAGKCGAKDFKVSSHQARAMTAMGEYDRALHMLEDLAQRWPAMENWEDAIKFVHSRNREHFKGEYNFGEMYEQAAIVPPVIKCATFSSLVQVQPSPGRGMGLYTIQPVSAGDIVLCEKALGYAFSDYGSRDPTTAATGLIYSDNTKTIFFGGQARLLSDLIQKLRYTPGLMDQNQFSQLYHGDYEVVSAKPLVDGQPVVDTFHVAEVIAVSGMGAPRTSLEAFRDKGDESHAAYASCGLWPLASRMNHSCLPNCRRSFIGDMLIVRATRDLPAGTELEISYRGGSRALTTSDQEWLKSTWGFACKCKLCTSNQVSPSETLWYMLKSLDRTSKAMPIDGAQAAKTNKSNARKLLLQMRASEEYTELDRNVRRSYDIDLDHAEFRVKLASILFRMGDPWDAIKMALSGLRLLGFDIASPPLKEGAKAKPEFCVRRWGVATDSALDAFLLLLKAYKSAHPSVLPMLRPYALKMYNMVIGEESTAAVEFLEFDPEIK
ncbi:hypothetical protein PG984_015245 [Apiospora sp. TS-2023a]